MTSGKYHANRYCQHHDPLAYAQAAFARRDFLGTIVACTQILETTWPYTRDHVAAQALLLHAQFKSKPRVHSQTHTSIIDLATQASEMGLRELGAKLHARAALVLAAQLREHGNTPAASSELEELCALGKFESQYGDSYAVHLVYHSLHARLAVLHNKFSEAEHCFTRALAEGANGRVHPCMFETVTHMAALVLLALGRSNEVALKLHLAGIPEEEVPYLGQKHPRQFFWRYGLPDLPK